MNRFSRSLFAAPLVIAALLAGALVPQAAHAETSLNQYTWWAGTPFLEYGVGDFLIESGAGGSRLIFQTDGNLVLYSSSGKALWHSRTYGRGAAKLAFQSDGNVVVYRADNVPLWASGVSRSRPDSIWSLDMAGTSSSPTLTEHNWDTGSAGYWRIP